MKLQITQEDIDKATSGSYNCPVARALKRTRKPLNCVVGRSAASLRVGTDPFAQEFYELCESARLVVDLFDRNELLVPMEVELEKISLEECLKIL